MDPVLSMVVCAFRDWNDFGQGTETCCPCNVPDNAIFNIEPPMSDSWVP